MRKSVVRNKVGRNPEQDLGDGGGEGAMQCGTQKRQVVLMLRFVMKSWTITLKMDFFLHKMK